MSNDLYNIRPQKIMKRLEYILKPLGYAIVYDKYNNGYSIKKGCKSVRCPYFYKDRKGKIYMKIRTKQDNVVIKCIDYETDEWLAYYAYKEIIK